MGFIVYHCHTRFSASTNTTSAVRNPTAVEEYLATELAAGRIASLFVDREVHRVQVSRFGVISKGGRPGEWRPILDLSSPPNLSVNDGIDPQMCLVQYLGATTRGTARTARCGPCHLEHPSTSRGSPFARDHKILDLGLPFDLRSFPTIFMSVTDALEWVLRHKGVSWRTHYGNNFLTIGQPNTHKCKDNLAIMISTCEWSEVPLKS